MQAYALAGDTLRVHAIQSKHRSCRDRRWHKARSAHFYIPEYRMDPCKLPVYALTLMTSSSLLNRPPSPFILSPLHMVCHRLFRSNTSWTRTPALSTSTASSTHRLCTHTTTALSQRRSARTVTRSTCLCSCRCGHYHPLPDTPC
jgi:hypothetical protein